MSAQKNTSAPKNIPAADGQEQGGALDQNQAPPAAEQNAGEGQPSLALIKFFVVTTDRRPCWDGKPRREGYIIPNPEADPEAMMAMSARGWIREGEASDVPAVG
jgi:hypothetical protein